MNISQRIRVECLIWLQVEPGLSCTLDARTASLLRYLASNDPVLSPQEDAYILRSFQENADIISDFLIDNDVRLVIGGLR